MRLIFKNGSIEIWTAGNEFLVFGVTRGGDPIAWAPSRASMNAKRNSHD